MTLKSIEASPVRELKKLKQQFGRERKGYREAKYQILAQRSARRENGSVPQPGPRKATEMTDNGFRLDELVKDQQPVSVQPGLTVLNLRDIAMVPELLERAKHSIESGVSSLRDAAEYLADAQALGVSQRQLADGVGKSAAWVNALLKWRQHGYPEDTPFKYRRPLANTVQQAEQSRCEAMDTGTSDVVQADASGEPAETAKLDADNPEESEVVEPEDHANADAFGDNRTDTTFSSVRRENLIEALEFLGSARPGIRARFALIVERRRAELALTWNELLIPANET